jgi:hypothetical protein
MTDSNLQMAGTKMTDGNDAGRDAGTRKTIRRTAFGLALVAVGMYFGFIALRLI